MNPGRDTHGGTTPVQEKVRTLFGLLRDCILCPRKCRVDRTAGERGFCGLAGDALVSAALPHHGEEPVISGTGGAGTIFFSSCNLKCIFCQNYQISHIPGGRPLGTGALAKEMMVLEEKKCHNIEAVTATPHAPFLAAAVVHARMQGMALPVVYNCGGYENSEVVKLLEGTVDVYLPDFKYGDDEDAHLFSGVRDYVAHATAAIAEMIRQVGDDIEVEAGIARRGIIIRHLVLPGHVENSLKVLALIERHFPLSVPLSIMSQYTPVPTLTSGRVPGRRVTRKEYERVVNAAMDRGFEYLFVQDVDERHIVPDFGDDAPFHWN